MGDGRSSNGPSTRSLGKIDHVEDLANDFGDLLDDSRSSKTSDVTFVVEKRHFRCHRVILAARCAYFEALLYNGMRESSPNVEIAVPDTTASAFAQLLAYVYTGRIDLSSCGEQVTQDLLSLAHKYQLNSLQLSISDFLKATLTSTNVCDVFDVATLFQLDELRSSCLSYLDQNACDVMNSDSFVDLSASALEELLKRVSFSAPEIEIFRGVRRWMEKNDIGDEGAARVISGVRLPLIPLSDLLGEVRQSKLVTSDCLLDAINDQEKSSLLDYRGQLVPDVNLATPLYSARVTHGEMAENLLNGEEADYDLERGFTCHQISASDSSAGIVIELGRPSLINTIRFLLWDKDVRSYSYVVDVAVVDTTWDRIIDYSGYPCRSWQSHYFDSRVVRYIRLVGTNNTMNKVFHVVSFKCLYTTDKLPLFQLGILVPQHNVASVESCAAVIEGVSRLRNALIDGNVKDYDWDSGYTCHQLGNGAIVVQLAQPYIIGSCGLLLWDCDDRYYSYQVEVSTDGETWTVVANRRSEQCRSWQTLTFSPIAVVFFRIIGTKNTANEVFHCVHFECPSVTNPPSANKS